MKVHDEADAQVIRGEFSWAYIYAMLGLVLGIEGTIIGMITPLVFPNNLLAFLAIGALTAGLFLFSGRFQNKLIGWKSKHEGQAR